MSAALKLDYSDALIRLPEVMAIVSLSKAMVYRLIARGDFPRPTKAGCSSSRWSENEVRQWVIDRLAARGTEALAR